ncbi:MAG TPA: hypothetical protein PLV45_08300, partial [bacterium]|nr:hypothetical protein [bacterium]
PDFLAARRELLAAAANRFFAELLHGPARELSGVDTIEGRIQEISAATVRPGCVASEEEARLIQACNAWVQEQGLPGGKYGYELVDPETELLISLFDLAWPAGIQEGLSQPVALLIDDDDETYQAANQAGFRYFTSVEAFKEYVLKDILGSYDSAVTVGSVTGA